MWQGTQNNAHPLGNRKIGEGIDKTMKNISNHIFFQIKVKLTAYPKALKVTKYLLSAAYHHFN